VIEQDRLAAWFDAGILEPPRPRSPIPYPHPPLGDASLELELEPVTAATRDRVGDRLLAEAGTIADQAARDWADGQRATFYIRSAGERVGILFADLEPWAGHPPSGWIVGHVTDGARLPRNGGVRVLELLAGWVRAELFREPVLVAMCRNQAAVRWAERAGVRVTMRAPWEAPA
jgi:hypothetical protein